LWPTFIQLTYFRCCYIILLYIVYMYIYIYIYIYNILLYIYYHRGSNWGSSTRGTALTRYVFIGCCDSGNNPDSNACRNSLGLKYIWTPLKIEPGLVMWWSILSTYYMRKHTLYVYIYIYMLLIILTRYIIFMLACV
jgi:hypothetical protein